MPKKLPWLKGGLLLGAVFLLAVILVKPIGVSTQFVIFDAMVWDMVKPDVITESITAKAGYASTNAYLNGGGGKYAAEAANPLNYSFIFVLAMMFGAWLSARLGGDRPEGAEKKAPKVWTDNYSQTTRYATVFLAGILVLFGARLAGGCTSGHMMSGLMQSSVSAYLFTLGTFLAAIPTAILLFKKGRN